MSEEFWADDAAAIRQAEEQRAIEARTGLRMPPASGKTPQPKPSTFRPAAQKPVPVATLASSGKSAGWWIGVITAGMVIGSVACAAIGYAAGWIVLNTQDVVTLAEFEQLRTGMTIEQANEIVGAKGTEQMETNAFGHRVTVISWQNSGGTTASASFTNGKLDSKFQIGLQL